MSVAEGPQLTKQACLLQGLEEETRSGSILKYFKKESVALCKNIKQENKLEDFLPWPPRYKEFLNTIVSYKEKLKTFLFATLWYKERTLF